MKAIDETTLAASLRRLLQGEGTERDRDIATRAVLHDTIEYLVKCQRRWYIGFVDNARDSAAGAVHEAIAELLRPDGNHYPKLQAWLANKLPPVVGEGPGADRELAVAYRSAVRGQSAWCLKEIRRALNRWYHRLSEALRRHIQESDGVWIRSREDRIQAGIGIVVSASSDTAHRPMDVPEIMAALGPALGDVEELVGSLPSALRPTDHAGAGGHGGWAYLADLVRVWASWIEGWLGSNPDVGEGLSEEDLYRASRDPVRKLAVSVLIGFGPKVLDALSAFEINAIVETTVEKVARAWGCGAPEHQENGSEKEIFLSLAPGVSPGDYEQFFHTRIDTVIKYVRKKLRGMDPDDILHAWRVDDRHLSSRREQQ